MALKAPSPNFANAKLQTKVVLPSTLIRVSRHNTGEPFFGNTRRNRFDDPNVAGKRYGTCYFGAANSLHCAFSETVLHDEVIDLSIPGLPGYRVARTELDRYVVEFSGVPLNLAVMHGPALQHVGCDGGISTESPYSVTQQWSRAVYEHPMKVDGFEYQSRVCGLPAVVLFSRAKKKLKAVKPIGKFIRHPDAATVLVNLPVFVF